LQAAQEVAVQTTIGRRPAVVVAARADTDHRSPENPLVGVHPLNLQ
jgi:hypothetical protein